MKIRLFTSNDKEIWDTYVLNHPESTNCHLSGWKEVIEKVYGHKSYYLIAEQSSNKNYRSNPTNPNNLSNTINSSIVGLLPLIHIKSLFFGNKLVSMPFLNYGGIIAENKNIEIELLFEAIKLGQSLKVDYIEFRHLTPLSCLTNFKPTKPSSLSNSTNPINCFTKTHKVRMLLDLPDSKEVLFKSFKAKLRSQIMRPKKEGMTAVVGGEEYLDSFYKVFSINMRDLGSPVHSKKFFEKVFEEFSNNIKIGVVFYKNEPVASGIIFCYRNIVEIPWASSLKKFNKFSPNMLLYWSLIGYACDNGFRYFDFGRSTPNEGTYKFKEQWGAKPSILYWHNIVFNGYRTDNFNSEKSKFEKSIQYWKKLPVFISNIIGPKIRKHIDL